MAGPLNTEGAWRTFLAEWNSEIWAQDGLDPAIVSPLEHGSWLGEAPLSASELSDWQSRTNLRLPLSYRTFLLASNGWRCVGPYYRFGGPLRSLSRVGLLVESEENWIEAYEGADDIPESAHRLYGGDQDPSAFRAIYLRQALQIGERDDDGGVYLLVPAVTNADGEWEAWHLANWLAGARRYRSFGELIQAERIRLGVG